IYRGENATPVENRIPAAVLIDGLSRVARDPTSPYRFLAIARLGTFGSNAVPSLLTIIEEKNSPSRQISIHTLGELKAAPELVIPALTNLLNDPDPGTRMAASSALRTFGYNAQFQPHVPDRIGMPGRPDLPGRTN